MKKKSIVEEKSYKFAKRMIKFYKCLIEKKRDYILSKQLLRCGTSIVANVKEDYKLNPGLILFINYVLH